MSFKEYPTKAEAVEAVKAIDKELRNPRPPTWIGARCRGLVPQAYTPGAIGWTATECEVLEEPVSKTALVALSTPAVALGKRDVVVDAKLVALDLTQGVLPEKPVKYETKLVADEPVKVGK